MNHNTKVPSEVSGFYIECHNPETKELEYIVFEELPEDEQKKWLDNADINKLKTLVRRLTRGLNELREIYR